MDSLFENRVLTAAVNAIKAPTNKIFNRFFRPIAKMQSSSLLQFDVFTGSQKLVGSIAADAPATMTALTGKKTITLSAPRLAQKRFIPASLIADYRKMGSRIGPEMLKDRIATEMLDMLNIMNRTIEWYAAGAMQSKIYDNDTTTVLVDYLAPAAHLTALTGDDLWSDVDSIPLAMLREFKRTIEAATQTPITGWKAYIGADAMDALMNHADILAWLQSQRGVQVAENGTLTKLAGIDIEEMNDSFIHTDGTTRKYYVGAKKFLLIGLCNQLVSCPFAPVMDLTAPNGVGNVSAKGGGQLYYAGASDVEFDPSGRWIKVESRPLPVLQRPTAIIYKTVVA